MDAAVARDAPLIEIAALRHAFRKPDGSELLVLDDVTFRVGTHEIVGLLGRSGSGKSTLLRCIAGLTRPSSGRVVFGGQAVTAPPPGMSMVFQSFALFPWLTVQDNVELGLDATGIGAEERRARAEGAIDLIGLSGYESAYPKELSGGMRQRVGFARALVVHPQALLMDEPFSALDVLTAETLRTDLLELWNERRLPMRAILMVTHNIEEAVLMCDRILIFASNPGRVAAELPIALTHPRNRQDPAFRRLVDQVYVLMTQRPEAGRAGRRIAGRSVTAGIGERLPRAGIDEMAGLLEALASAEYGGRADLPRLAEALQLEIDELFPVAEALQLLGFADVAGGDIRLLPAGRRFVDGEVQERKSWFADQLKARVPLASHMLRVLADRPQSRAPRLRFRAELEDFLSEGEADAVLETLIGWARYAELFSYDDDEEAFALEGEHG